MGFESASISEGRIYIPPPPGENLSLAKARGINYHNAIAKILVDVFGSGTVKIEVGPGKDPFYANRASCFKWVHDVEDIDTNDQAYKDFVALSDDEIITIVKEKAQDLSKAKKPEEKKEVPPKPLENKPEKPLEKLTKLEEKQEASQAELNAFFGKARGAFETMFEGSSYPLAKIPNITLPDPYMAPERKHMTARVTRGTSYDGSRPYVAIQVDCTTSEEELKSRGLAGRKKEDTIIFYKNYKSDSWHELIAPGDAKVQPDFFNGNNFTDPANGKLFADEQKLLQRMQELLTKGEAVDGKGISWRIPSEA